MVVIKGGFQKRKDATSYTFYLLPSLRLLINLQQTKLMDLWIKRTVMPRFLRFRTPQFRKFAGSPLEQKYITRAFKWIAASKLFDNSNMSSSRNGWCSKNWKGEVGRSTSPPQCFCKVNKNIKKLNNYSLGGRSDIRGYLPFFLRWFLEPNPREKQGMIYVV
jgi:hypothetical protein